MADTVIDALAVKSIKLPSFPTASLPANAVAGQLAYDTTTGKLAVYTGAAWEQVTSA